MRKLLLFLIVLLAGSFCFAATLSGQVISWETLNPLNGAVIDVNSEPQQRMISKEGAYSFALEPGDYKIQVVYYSKGAPSLYSLEEISIVEEGDFVFDLILFPISEADLNRLALLEGSSSEPTQGIDYTFLLAVLVIAVVFFGLLVFFKTRFKKIQEKIDKEIPATGEKPIEPKEEELDKNCHEVLDVLKRYGNRLTQKELREKVSFGEAKVSLVVAELEEAGLVKKIKRGRGNIIILKKKKPGSLPKQK